VRVTNLDNGSAVVVRINDRGPFVEGRIIDLSANAARALGLEEPGVQQVRIDLVASES
jgi:rare lipoprotein A